MKQWFSRLQSMKKEDFIVIGLAGVLCVLLAFPTTEKDTGLFEQRKVEDAGIESEKTTDSEEESYYNEYWEEKLEETLRLMEGVGEAEVVITLQNSGEKIVEKDIPVTRSNTREEDGQGGTREINEFSSTETTLVYQDKSGNQVPFVTRETLPLVEGVVVCARGAENPGVREKITELVCALFDIEAHKIVVVKMK